MKRAIRNLGWLYERLLRLYPRAYSQEYDREMRSVFELTADAADRRGLRSLLKLCLRELCSLPGAIIHEYWRDARRNVEDATMTRLVRKVMATRGAKATDRVITIAAVLQVAPDPSRPLVVTKSKLATLAKVSRRTLHNRLPELERLGLLVPEGDRLKLGKALV